MEQQLIKLLMHKEFFDANKTRVMRSMFPNELTDLYDTIVNGHENYERDLSSQEVREIYRVSNPGSHAPSENNGKLTLNCLTLTYL